MEFSSGLITPVVLCGGFDSQQSDGGGAEKPKPFQSRSGNLSPFQQTLLRVSDPGRFNAPMIVADQAHESLIEFQMEMIGAEHSALVLEPVSRGTAASLGLAALVSGAFKTGGALLALPCHHRVRDPNALMAAIDQGLTGTRSGALVTFGRKVQNGDEPHAWMQRGGHLFDEAGNDVVDAEVYRLNRFLSKTEDKDADALAESGDCYRNSGMYLFPVTSVLEELRKHAPDVLTACQQALVAGRSTGDTLVPNKDKLAACPEASIEHALMENTECAAVVPTVALWSEEGARPPALKAPEREARVNEETDTVVLREVSNSHVSSAGPLTVVAGLDDVVVVNSDDGVIIAAKDQVAALLTGAEAQQFKLPEAALQMLREAARSADEPAEADPAPPEDEEADDEEELLASYDVESGPATIRDVLDDLFHSEEGEMEPALLLHEELVTAA